MGVLQIEPLHEAVKVTDGFKESIVKVMPSTSVSSPSSTPPDAE